MYAQLWSPTAVVVIVAAISVVAGLRHVGLSRGERAELLRLVRALPANRGRIGPRGLPAAILQPAKVAGQKAPGVSGGIGAVPRLAGPGSPEVSPKLWFVGDLEPRLSSQSSDEPPSDTPAPRGVLIKGVSARTSIPIARRVLEDEDKKEWRTRLALEMIDALPEVDLEGAVVAADTGYGSLSGFRRGLTARGLPYLLRVGPVTAARELAPDGPSPSAAEARDVLQERIAAQPQPRVAWREPELVVLRGAEQILVCEGPNLGGGGTFWLSNLPAGTAPQRLALLLRLANRGRVERAASGPLRDAHK